MTDADGWTTDEAALATEHDKREWRRRQKDLVHTVRLSDTILTSMEQARNAWGEEIFLNSVNTLDKEFRDQLQKLSH